VPRGALAALIGPNGAGKTTLANIIAGALKAEAGKVVFAGTDITGWSSHRIARRRLIRTFQISREFGALTVLENMLAAAPDQAGESFVTAVLRPGVGKRQDAELLERALERLNTFGLYHLRDDYARNLSGGQKRLLELARAVMAEPSLLILDEPMAGVNPALIQVLAQHIVSLGEGGITFLMIEHNLNIVEQMCDYVVVMAEGRTLATGTMAELRNNEEVIHAYLGGTLHAHAAG
jgi:ABC-type branched-subunit amino acid transport system ATPase component